ncbi:hypothetical protein, partial [Paracholeplasma manati]
GQNLEVTSMYNVRLYEGTLTVLPIEITIQTESLVKAYDGIALTSQGWIISAGQLLNGHRIEYVMTS